MSDINMVSGAGTMVGLSTVAIVTEGSEEATTTDTDKIKFSLIKHNKS